jgi:hypothetical protein
MRHSRLTKITGGAASAIVLAVLVLSPAIAQASVLTFDAKGIPNTRPFPVGYGDNITTTTALSGDAAANSYGLGNGETPNIAIDLSPSAPQGTVPPATDGISSFYYYDDTTNWPKVAELYTATGGDNINVFTITFNPDPNYQVRINSFDLLDFPNYQAGHTVDWEVLDIGNNVLASGTENLPASVAGVPSNVTPVTSVMSGFALGQIRLVITHTSGHAADLALDNVNFDQYLPEPTSAVLLALTCLVGAKRPRRQR